MQEDIMYNSPKAVTLYTQGNCHLLSYCLSQKFSENRVIISELCDIMGPCHSFICIERGEDNQERSMKYLDICGSYRSHEHIIESWNIISPANDYYIREFASKNEIDNWWLQYASSYTKREQKETIDFIQKNLDTFLNPPFMTQDRCLKIKKMIWGDDCSITFDVSEIIKKILQGETIDFSKFDIIAKN
jgi:hypothetical protein